MNRRLKAGSRSTSKTGASLIETLIALALLGTVLLWTMAVLALEPGAHARIDAHRAALHLLEGEIEAARAGLWTPEVGEHVLEIELPDESTLQLIEATSLRRERPRRGLAELTLTARYQVGGATFERKLETMIFGY